MSTATAKNLLWKARLRAQNKDGSIVDGKALDNIIHSAVATEAGASTAATGTSVAAIAGTADTTTGKRGNHMPHNIILTMQKLPRRNVNSSLPPSRFFRPLVHTLHRFRSTQSVASARSSCPQQTTQLLQPLAQTSRFQQIMLDISSRHTITASSSKLGMVMTGLAASTTRVTP